MAAAYNTRRPLHALAELAAVIGEQNHFAEGFAQHINGNGR